MGSKTNVRPIGRKAVKVMLSPLEKVLCYAEIGNFRDAKSNVEIMQFLKKSQDIYWYLKTK